MLSLSSLFKKTPSQLFPVPKHCFHNTLCSHLYNQQQINFVNSHSSVGSNTGKGYKVESGKIGSHAISVFKMTAFLSRFPLKALSCKTNVAENNAICVDQQKSNY